MLVFVIVLCLYLPYFVACIWPKTLVVCFSSYFDANFDILLFLVYFLSLLFSVLLSTLVHDSVMITQKIMINFPRTELPKIENPQSED